MGSIGVERRGFLRGAVAFGAMVALGTRSSHAAWTPAAIDMQHLHTGERVSIPHVPGTVPAPQIRATLERFLRDHYSGAIGAIDPALLGQLHAIVRTLECTRTIQIISGYRSAATNELLRRRGGGVARDSLHLAGQALDIRIPGVALADLRHAALGLRAGGVGYYPASDFVHIDTGRVRSW